MVWSKKNPAAVEPAFLSGNGGGGRAGRFFLNCLWILHAFHPVFGVSFPLVPFPFNRDRLYFVVATKLYREERGEEGIFESTRGDDDTKKRRI